MPVPVDQPERRSGPLLDHLARRMRLRAETALAPFGLRPRHLVALTLLREHGGSSQQALARLLEMDGTNIVGLLNDLETAQLVRRLRSPDDRRRHVVELTAAGAQRLTEAECALAATEDEVLGNLDEQQREALYDLLRRATTGSAGSGSAIACAEAAPDDAGAC
ncbi:MarR family winged helix-turn-helix transcriptional regulator [Plantactinospora sp. KBS50]|uniref:MarR family winged helix-turn-helix transcriptional regulator n=1 Tax=Plantactinospora sp. KBS50 TaxID=2024580 RepID=UPI000BAADF48|nr:MarR family winged helix-turn-helix transcriptional regulator [Plantactinospora sp. KBS50]ASW56863.1 MarR family transcriptional regulator [Plantactinospora sp. KBS50]